MTDHDVRDRIDRLMSDEPPHRPLPDLVRAGERGLRHRRLSLGVGALAVAAIAVGAGAALPQHGSGSAHDGTGFAGSTTPSTQPSVPATSDASTDPEMGQTLAPGKRASYSYSEEPACNGASLCDRYRFTSRARRAPVVAAIEFRLSDGSSKKVTTHHGAYSVAITGHLPTGDRWDDANGLVDATGQSIDLFAGLTLYAADGSVLATATATDSTQLDPYLEICSVEDDPSCLR